MRIVYYSMSRTRLTNATKGLMIRPVIILDLTNKGGQFWPAKVIKTTHTRNDQARSMSLVNRMMYMRLDDLKHLRSSIHCSLGD